MAARQPSQSELDATRALLTHLGLEWVAQCLPVLLERAVKEELSLPKFLHLVCQPIWICRPRPPKRDTRSRNFPGDFRATARVHTVVRATDH